MMNHNIPKLLRAFFLVLVSHVESSMHVLSWRATDANVQCREKEKQALLNFKHGLVDYYGRLSSWGNQDGDTDCCRWNGIRCSNHTGHIEMLDLGDDTLQHPLRGEISTSLMNLQHLKYLNLFHNDFNGSHIPEFFGSLTKLRFLYLSSASSGGKIPFQLGKLSRLQVLDLSGNNLVGLIPYQLGNLCNLQILRLGMNNNLSVVESSACAPWISNLSSLTEIGLRCINLHNSFKWLQAIGRLPNISRLFLSNCSLSDADFLWLSSSQPNFSASLTVLGLSDNYITSWVFRSLFNKMPYLEYLYLSGNRLYRTIPESIGLLSELQFLDLGGNFLEGVITNTHFANLTKLKQLSLYDNSLTLKFNNSWIPPFDLKYLELDSCKVGPTFPKWLLTQNKLSILDISDAGISDAIPESLFCGDSNANNSLKSLVFLNLSNNELSGQIPNCWNNLKSLVYLDLSNNQLSGSVPITMGFLVEIRSLNFRNNSLTGELPSLKNCTKLVLLDAGENGLSGSVPTWIGDSMQSLEMLTLRKNHFNGSLSLQICHLTKIQILDLSLNNLSGQIPGCLKNFSAMAKKIEYSSETMGLWYPEYYYKGDYVKTFLSYDLYPFVMWKGKELQFKNKRRLLKTIDLSSNQLSGEIPAEIGDLVELVALNLSKNILMGEIPPEIGNMHSLDFLDLSRNHFSGKIPRSLALIDRLGVLDLSNNNLSGKIPTGTQLQGFDACVYEGNPYLCGSPLQRPCPDETKSEDPLVVMKHEEDLDDSDFMEGLYMSIGLGFFTGFWAIFGSLLVFRSWRHAYFNFLNDVKERIIVTAIINIARCRRLLNE